MNKEKLITMVKNLGLGHYGDILITTQERVVTNKPPIASNLIDEQQAMRIVRACNNHDKLLDALENLIWHVSNSVPWIQIESAIKRGRDAIAEAEKTESQ